MQDAGVRPTDIDGLVVHSFVDEYVSSFRTADMIGIPEPRVFLDQCRRVGVRHGGAHRRCRGRFRFDRHVPHPAADHAEDHDRGIGPAPGAEVLRVGPKRIPRAIRRHHRGTLGRHVHAAHDARVRIHRGDVRSVGSGPARVRRRQPGALFRDPITIDDYLAARYINKPLRLLDCDYPVDSCSALLFTTEERARDLAHKPILFESWAMGTVNPGDFNLVPSMTHSSAYNAAKRMWAKTELQPADVDIAGLYDGFTFITLQWLEALGFCGEGESGPFVLEGNTRPGGRLPVNTDGGACNMGRRHGANFFIEVTRQLRGDCGERQIPGAEVGAVSNSVGGFTACALLSAG